MSVLTGYSGCTVLFFVAGGLPSNVFTMPRRLESLSFLSSISFASVLGAVFAGMLRGVRDYPRALALLQMSEVTLYMVTAIVIHVLVGNDVASPSLKSVSPIFKKISYGIAIPTVADRISQIVIAGAVNAHVAVKSIYLRMFHSRNAMQSRPLGAISLWAAVCVTLWFLAWVFSESTPVFNDILGLASSFFASWFIFNLPGVFWLYLNVHGKPLNWKQTILIGFNCIIVTIGVVIVSWTYNCRWLTD
ncbi:hypothetical protein ASPNIDRAFT_123490 [Aspergillus niger ATCC 1015]|uniref:Amino acid transporter transmembrane domain-containing protein n=1 Tax=Aspergillus niger (strain ATCC 1015 / CBS 113.46 / FGSC A1144 / LSHB Ac4 / NCTC 3858a / NRRL 328 / USDA 3528.7) TaxID=380704 RepID=G3YF88_ASPNA|nr:hypothetical protein ASPNIDRAFT_123490 [Aspergillus niger ATCC 1015]